MVYIVSGRDVLASCQLEPIGSDWSRHEAILKSVATSNNATLKIEFRGPATVWIDKVSLMPTETISGWRPDVVDAIRAMGPGIIRFGGTSVREYYEWEEGIGDVDQRVPFVLRDIAGYSLNAKPHPGKSTRTSALFRPLNGDVKFVGTLRSHFVFKITGVWRTVLRMNRMCRRCVRTFPLGTHNHSVFSFNGAIIGCFGSQVKRAIVLDTSPYLHFHFH